jgi:glycosyltransferase involved in cell wall biosynthesis
MPQISIIVPVYKVEKYIDRCVQSIINQTLQDIEIILVDDGSPDTCPGLCDEWSQRDKRIKVIHKQNGGLSSARNAGMKIATGKYIGFVDSDDDVDPDMYMKMYTVAEREQVDFVMSDYIRILNDGTSYLKTLDIDEGRYDKEKIRKDIFPNLIMRESIDYGPLLSVWHCIYRIDFLRKFDLHFDEEVKWSEDNIFSAIMGYQCRSFYYMKGEGLYHYYNNPGTITTSYRKGAWKVYCTMNEHLHEFFDKVDEYDFGRQLKLHMIYYACNCTGMAMQLQKSEAISEIKSILNDENLKESFRELSFTKVPIKLKMVLYIMKLRMPRLLYRLKK